MYTSWCQIESHHELQRLTLSSLISEDMLAINHCWERENKFSLKVLPLWDRLAQVEAIYLGRVHGQHFMDLREKKMTQRWVRREGVWTWGAYKKNKH